MFKKRFLILFLICFIGRSCAEGATAPEPVVLQKPAQKVVKQVTKPVVKQAVKPVAKSVEKVVVKPVAKPVQKTVIKTAEKPFAKPVQKTVIKTAEKPVAKPVQKTVIKTAEKPVVKAVVKVPALNSVVLKTVAPANPVVLAKPVVAISPIQSPLPPITQAPSVTAPQSVEFSLCTKGYKLDDNKLFYLTLAALNANRFKIREIQSNCGYVLFSVGQRQFLATVINMGPQNSMLKITPADGVYYFPVGIVQNMFKYIELNLALKIEQLTIL